MIKRWITLSYLICLNSIVFFFTYGFNLRAINEGFNSTHFDFFGLALSTVYLATFLFIPLYHKLDSFLVLGSMFFFFVLLWILPGNEAFGIFKQISFRIIIVIGYFFLRKKEIEKVKQTCENEALNRELLRTSYLDNLTKTFNRNALDQYLKEITDDWQNITKASILMFDIDYFKLYNDKYSHAQGDEVLKHFSSLLMDSFKDNYVFRFGGEEFLIIVLNKEEKEVVDFAKECKRVIDNANIKRDDDSGFDHLTVSIGCADLEIKDGAFTDYITMADKELYICKESGKNCICYRGIIYR